MSDPNITMTFATIAGLIACSGFFSGSETALMSGSKAKLHALDKDGNNAARRVLKLTNNPDVLLSTILLGNNLVNILSSALATKLALDLYGDPGIAFATMVMTIIVLIFAEILPKSIASRKPEPLGMAVSIPMSILVVALRPLTLILQGINFGFIRALGFKDDGESFDEHDVRGAIGMGLEHGVLDGGEQRMLDSILDLDAMTVEDVMIHRSNIDGIEASSTVEEFTQAFSESDYSRLPVYQDDEDNIIGVIHVREFYNAMHKAQKEGTEFDPKSMMKNPYFVPMTAAIDDQLLEFKRLRTHLALVVDEYGDLQGLVTLEDILEEIVGDIVDEFDTHENLYRTQEDGSVIVAGTLTVRDANRELDWELPADDAVTLAGLVIEELGRIPNVGEEVITSGMTFRILAKKRQAIVRMLAKVNPKEADNS
jgi:Mg2+/Co2+ transporter CorB